MRSRTIAEEGVNVPKNKYGIIRASIRWDTESDPRNPGWVLDTIGSQGNRTDPASLDTYHLERSERAAMAALRGSLWFHYGIKI